MYVSVLCNDLFPWSAAKRGKDIYLAVSHLFDHQRDIGKPVPSNSDNICTQHFLGGILLIFPENGELYQPQIVSSAEIRSIHNIPNIVYMRYCG